MPAPPQRVLRGGENDIIDGNLTIGTGSSFINSGSFLFLSNANIINNGVLNGSTAASTIYWGGTAPGTYSGTGTATAALPTMSFDNAGGVTFDPAVSNIPVLRVNLFTGNIINASKLTLGNGGTTTGTVQIGNATTPPTAAGTFDVAPTFNLGTGGQAISYMRTTASRSMGPEVNPTRILSALTVDDNDASHTLTMTGGNLTVSASATPTFTFTNGKVNLNGSILTLGFDGSTQL